MAVIRELNASFATLQRATDREWAVVKRALTYRADHARFSRAYRAGYWKGDVCFVTKARTFPCGMVLRARRALREAGFDAPMRGLPFIERPVRYPRVTRPRDYQIEGPDLVFKFRKLCLQSPTASGKSLIGVEICRRTGSPTLWMVNGRDLFRQTVDVLRHELHEPIGMIRGRERTIARVTVAMVQTLMQIQMKEFWLYWRAMILDEVHLAGAATWYRAAMKCTNAVIRAGLSGTARTGNIERDMRREAAVGPIKVLRTGRELINRQLISEPEFLMSRPHPKSYPTIEQVRDAACPGWRDDGQLLFTGGVRCFAWAYRHGIIRNAYRNRMIARLANHLTSKNAAVLVLVAKLEHGEKLWGLIDGSTWIHGEHSDRVRGRAIASLKRAGQLREGHCLIASSILNAAIDIREITDIILAGGHQSEVLIRQQFGRGMRRAPGKFRVRIWDFLDGREANKHDYLYKHTIARLRIYKKLGYRVRRVKGLAA